MRDEKIKELANMKINKIMIQAPEILNEDEEIAEVIEKFKTNKHFVFPVVNHKNEVVGTISKSDLLKLVIGSKLSGELILKEGVAGDLIKNIMSDTVTLSPEDNIENAAHLMFKNNIRMIPITIENKLIGIITETEIVMEILKRK